jgi:hypothetical protein
MQENCIDYYEELGENDGCCLNCDSSEDGCLCFKCKCRKCYWYNWNYRECERKEDYERLVVEKKEKFIAGMKKEEAETWERVKKMKEIYSLVEKRMLKEGKIVNVYSCQKCQREIVSIEELDIKKGIKPLCLICRGCL